MSSAKKKKKRYVFTDGCCIKYCKVSYLRFCQHILHQTILIFSLFKTKTKLGDRLTLRLRCSALTVQTFIFTSGHVQGQVTLFITQRHFFDLGLLPVVYFSPHDVDAFLLLALISTLYFVQHQQIRQTGFRSIPRSPERGLWAYWNTWTVAQWYH